MKIIYNNIIPFSGYKAINLFGILFVRKEFIMSDVDINHEQIHTEQMKEMLFIGFYIWYVIEYIICYVSSKFLQKYSYHDISFEEEAYNNQENLNYIKTRKRYSWIKYIKIKSYSGKN